MTEEENKPLEWKEENLTYIGKELKSQSKVDSEKQWKIFKLNFDVQSTYNFTINCFDSLGSKEGYTGLTLKDLEEGNDYFFKYKVEKDAFTNAGGKLCDSRTIYLITKATGIARKGLESNGIDIANFKEDVTPAQLKQFETAFVKAMKDGNKQDTPTNFKLTWFSQNHKVEYKLIKDYADARVLPVAKDEETIDEEPVDEETGTIKE